MRRQPTWPRPQSYGRPLLGQQNINVVFGDYHCSWEGAAASVKHDPTGLYLYGGWGRQHFDNVSR